MPVNNLIKLRRGTDWTSNPILSQGEPGFDTTNNILKIGDGITAWDALTPIGSGLDYLRSHPNISAANSSDNTGRTYIQDVILDPNGHVIGISTGTETGALIETDTLATVTARGNTTTTNCVIPFYYANQAAFPSATTYHGAIAHSHADGAVYFAHAGAWSKLANQSEVDSAGYLTSFTETNDLSATVTWANVPDANITESSVAQHSGALRLTESQIVDLQNYLTSFTETNDLSSAVVWVNVPDSNITESSVVQHSGALRLKESQIVDLQNYLTSFTETNDLSSAVVWANVPDINITESSVVQHTGSFRIKESQIVDLQNYLTSFTETNDLSSAVTWANVPDINITESSVVQHTGAFRIKESQVVDLKSYLTSESNDLSSVVTWANVPDINITESSVIQHSGALELTESQIVDLQTYLTEHPTIASAASSSDNSGRTYIQDILLDSNGHVIGITTETESVVNTDTNTEYTAGTGIALQGTEFNVEPSLISGRTEVTSVDADYLLIWDATDSELKKVDAGEFLGGGDIVDDTTPQLGGDLDAQSNNINSVGTLTATSLVKSGGASSEFLKADGSVDTNTYLTSFTETNDLSSAVVWINVPNANITQSSVTQHQAALSITESQISDLQSYLTSYTETDTLANVSSRGNTTTTTCVIPFLYANQAAFPNASTYHGAIAHSHSDGAMYFAHGGAWTKLANDSDILNEEKVEDFVGGMVTGNTQNGITVTYDDTNGVIDFTVTSQTDENFTTADHSKLDGIEALADVTDATNVDTAGAVMNSDSSTASMSFVVDEDNMTSDSATKVPTQQSVKAYVDANAGGDTLTEEQVEDFVGGMLTGNAETGITVTYDDSDGTIDFAVTSQTDENFTTADHSKLDGIEALADVTDATNVDAAGAVMNSDTSTASMSFVVDEDNMASDSATKVPTQQSVKHYIDNAGYLTAHPNITDAASSSDNSGNSFIQDITLDSNGHVTDLTVATASAGGGGGIGSVVEDTTPQIGGNLDLNSKDINGIGNIDVTGSGHFSAKVEADSFVKDGGTSSQFLKADGSVDTSTYLTGSSSINSLSDVVTNSPINNNQVLAYSAGNFTNTDLSLALIARGSIPFGGYSTSQMGHYFFFDGSSEAVINTDGADINFRVEGDTNTHLLFTDAGTERVGIGTATPASTLDVNGTLTATTLIKSGGTSSQFLKADGSVDTSTYSTTDTQLTEEQVEDFVGGMVTGNTETGITVTYQDDDGTIDFVVASQTDENFTTADHSKLDGIEALADITDATNVDAAGAVMNSDSTTAGMSFVIDEDNMASDSATKVPTQQSVKAYVDANAGGGGGSLTTEQVQDIVGAMVDDTETGISVTYDDTNGNLEFVVDHDAANNFVANEHIDHTSVTLTAGDGLTGGGDISANRTFAVSVDDSTIEINSDALRIKDGAITSAKIGAGGFVFNEAGADADFRVEGDTNQNLLFVDGSTDRVGIGTATPSGELHIQDGTLYIQNDGSVPHFELMDTDTNNILRLNATNSVFAFNLDPGGDIAGSELRFNVDGTDKLTLKHNATVFDQNVTINSSTNQAIIGNSISVFNEGGANVDFRVEGDTDTNLLFLDASKDSVLIGAGSDGSLNSKVHVYEVGNFNTTNSRTVNILGRGYSTTNGTYYHIGLSSRAEKYLSASTTDGGYSIGVNASPVIYSPDGTNVLTEVTALRANPSINTAASNVTVTNAYDIKTIPHFAGTNNTITNHYGLYLGNAGAGGTTPTNEYGVYQDNTAATNYLGGSLGIGTTDPGVYKLRVAGGHSSFEGGNVQFDGGNVTVNQAGGNYDFRVEGDTEVNLLVCDASTDRVGIGTATPSVELDVNGNMILDKGSANRPTKIHGDSLGFISKKGDSGGWTFSVDAIGDSDTVYKGFGFYGSADTLNSIWIGGAYNTPYAKFTTTETVLNENGDNRDLRVEGDTDTDLLFVDAGNDIVQIGKLNINGAFTLPTADGSANQILKTDGNGAVSWAADGGGAGGGGSVTTVKGNGSQVGGADIVTLDFSSEFAVTESPDTEINIALSDEILSSGDLGTTLLGSTGIHLGYDSTADTMSINVNPALISARTEVTSADADYLLVWDATDSELKKVDAGEFRGGGGGGLSNIVEDTTPQLGGDLDVNGKDIVTTSNANIDLDPNGTGKVVFKGNASKGAGQFVLNCENNSHGIVIKGPPHSAGASYTLTLPNTDGSNNQVLKTDGSGNLDWVDQSGGGGSTSVAAISADATISSDVNLVTTANTDRTVTLPSVSSGKIVRIKKVDAGTGTVIIARGGSSTIDGATQVALYSQFESMTIICDGTNWHVF
jgi:hypothetical protein